MTAFLKIYLDKNCKQELARGDKGHFIYRFKKVKDGKEIPYVDGTTGTKETVELYLKNVGTRAALNPRILIEKKEGANIFVRNTHIYNDIPVGESEKITLEFLVAPWTESKINDTLIYLDYYSLPDATMEETPYSHYNITAKETYYGPKIHSEAEYITNLEKGKEE